MTEDRHKKFNILIFLLPIVDLITSISVRNFHLKITLGMVIKSLMMIYFMWYIFFITGSKHKKNVTKFIILLIIFDILYFVCKPHIIGTRFMLSELSYILKFSFFPVILSGLLCMYSDSGLDKKTLNGLLYFNMILYGLLLIIPLVTGTAFGTYSAGRGGFQGWFYSGNEVSVIIVLLFPFLYRLLENKNNFLFILMIPIIFAISRIGTKTAFFGLVIVGVIELIKYIHQDKKISKNVIKALIVLVFIGVFMYNGYTIKNMHTMLNEQEREERELLKEKHEKNNPDSKLPSVLKALLSNRDIYVLNLNDIYTSHLTLDHVLFGLGYSNTKDINDKTINKLAEIDIIDIFYHMGIVGTIIIIIPFIYTIIILIKYLKHNKLTTNITINTLMMLLALAMSSVCGHVLLDPAVSIYVAFYIVILLDELDYFKKKDLVPNKVQILALHLGYGGVERATITLGNMLSKKYDVEIISLYKTVDTIPYDVNKNIKIKYMTETEPHGKEFIEALKHFKIGKVFKYGIESIKLLHIKKYGMKNIISYSDAKYMVSTRIYFTKLLNSYGIKDAYKIGIEHDYNVNFKYVAMTKKNITNIDLYSMVSKKASEIYHTIMPNANIKYMPNSISKEYSAKSKLNTKKLIYVGRLEEEKGVIDLIRVFNKVYSKDKKVTLDIFGDGSLKSNMLNLIEKYNLQNNVKIHGFKDAKEINKYYKEASMYVMCSYRESFGIVLIEAMTCGIPCIAFTRATGACDIIEDGVNGYLIKDGNIDAMAEKILEYLKIKDKSKMQKAALETASKYSIENIEDMWFNSLQELAYGEKK